jgi:hypothetical protein
MNNSIAILIFIAIAPLIFAISSTWWFWLPKSMRTVRDCVSVLGDHAVSCPNATTVNKIRLKAEDGYSVSNGDKTVVLHHFPSAIRALYTTIYRISFLLSGLSMLLMLVSIVGNAKTELSEMSVTDFFSQVVPVYVLASVSVTPLAAIAYYLSNYVGLLVPLETTYAKTLEIARAEKQQLEGMEKTTTAKSKSTSSDVSASVADSLFGLMGSNDSQSEKDSTPNKPNKPPHEEGNDPMDRSGGSADS